MVYKLYSFTVISSLELCKAHYSVGLETLKKYLLLTLYVIARVGRVSIKARGAYRISRIIFTNKPFLYSSSSLIPFCS